MKKSYGDRVKINATNSEFYKRNQKPSMSGAYSHYNKSVMHFIKTVKFSALHCTTLHYTPAELHHVPFMRNIFRSEIKNRFYILLLRFIILNIIITFSFLITIGII